MRLLGIEIRHPAPPELALAAFLIIVMAAVGIALNALGFLSVTAIWPGVAAFSGGTLLAAFGISIAKHGWRASVLTVAAATIFWLLLTAFGLL